MRQTPHGGIRLGWKGLIHGDAVVVVEAVG
jgi:hypothetical protein